MDRDMKRQLFLTMLMTSLIVALAAGEGCNGSNRTPTAPTVPPSAPPAPPAVDLTGAYALTLVASPRCVTVTDTVSRQPLPFPSAVQTRAYDARIAQRGGELEVVFTPAECHGGWYGEPG